jgi:hypothetical protein
MEEEEVGLVGAGVLGEASVWVWDVVGVTLISSAASIHGCPAEEWATVHIMHHIQQRPTMALTTGRY